MKSLVSHIKRFDLLLLGAVFLLTSLGILSIWSSSVSLQQDADAFKQLIFFGVGLGALLVVSALDWRILRNDPIFILILYGIALVLLAGLLVFAPEIRGIRGWYRIGDISIDPIEFTKVVLVILMAKYFSMRHIEVYKIRHLILSGLYFALPMFLVFLQPDLGATLIFGFLWLGILLVSGIKLRHLLGLLGLAVLALIIGWTFFLHDYQKTRVVSFLEPELDPLGTGWNQLQAKIAIGNGGLFGQGWGSGTQTQYGFLPEPQTDFIFAAIAEEFGLVGVFALFSLYGLLIFRVLKIGFGAGSNFPRLFSAGIATLLLSQFAINVGMNLGLLPIVGIPLPFVSYGGSSLIMGYAALGVIQSIKTHGSSG